MIKIAYNKENANLVYEIDRIEREGMTPSGIVEKYVGTVKNTANNTEAQNVKISVIGFDAYWEEVPMNVVNTGTEVNNQNKEVTPTTSVQNVTYDSGYTGLGTVKVNAAPVDAAQTVTLSTSQDQTLTPSSGKVGLASVTVPAVTSAIDSNIAAGNIKKDVTILGVTGTFEGSTNPTTLIDAGYNYEWYERFYFLNTPKPITTALYNALLAEIDSTGSTPVIEQSLIQYDTLSITDESQCTVLLDKNASTGDIFITFSVGYTMSMTPTTPAVLARYVISNNGNIHLDYKTTECIELIAGPEGFEPFGVRLDEEGGPSLMVTLEVLQYILGLKASEIITE